MISPLPLFNTKCIVLSLLYRTMSDIVVIILFSERRPYLLLDIIINLIGLVHWLIIMFVFVFVFVFQII